MMNITGSSQEAQKLRVKMRMNNRLHLEVLAALSKTFRDNGQKVSDNLLRSLVFAVPEELPGEGALSKTAVMAPRYASSTIPPTPVSMTIPPTPVAMARLAKKKKAKTSKKKASKKSSKKR
jgi:hypothetical protein